MSTFGNRGLRLRLGISSFPAHHSHLEGLLGHQGLGPVPSVSNSVNLGQDPLIRTSTTFPGYASAGPGTAL